MPACVRRRDSARRKYPKSPRGLAPKFKVPNDAEVDIVAHRFDGFPTKTTALIPKNDWPASPTTTIAPNTKSQISIRASSFSSSALSTAEPYDPSLIEFVALFVVVIGVITLLMALVRILDHLRITGSPVMANQLC